ncbi:hypothetical protein [Edaphobacter modestus]|uniref:Uncharacterized protein n=1 Tax=Edaphobacter modestus TaxID=388466 RepID=A0A4Q7XX80_9BACT|nr:hypothetical protein [Edaphobacter modestus]RZU28900.1 hypothetical protein BDD14_6483 [Edaphobacter modestus]
MKSELEVLNEVAAEINRRLPDDAGAVTENIGGISYVSATIEVKGLNQRRLITIGTANDSWGASVHDLGGDDLYGEIYTDLPSDFTDVVTIVNSILNGEFVASNP